MKYFPVSKKTANLADLGPWVSDLGSGLTNGYLLRLAN